ncbi:hypothetical protein RhiirA5_441123 [Rhizophagus irregularis]|uniref:Uncharacterized protein n=1 Tax=Rhizophagus irregularis TaxID=588596 RepID=A0A2N0NFY0_9GLOM|nr:hypothetical protein RhiirA5_441123 [Rhizophagus irregularis]
MEPSVPLAKFVKNPLYQEIRYIEILFLSKDIFFSSEIKQKDDQQSKEFFFE